MYSYCLDIIYTNRICVICVGRWHCNVCSICTVCGTRNPEGHKNPNLTAKQRQRMVSTAKWSHEYRISHVSNLREHSAMLCSPCAQQRQLGIDPAATNTNPSGKSGIDYTTVLSPQTEIQRSKTLSKMSSPSAASQLRTTIPPANT